MPNYGKSSKGKLATCHEDLQKVMNVVIQLFDNTILCGRRNKAEQTKYFNEKRSKVEYPDSKHNDSPTSSAVDAAPYPINWDTEKELLIKYYKAKSDGIIDAMEKEEISKAENAMKRWYIFAGIVKGVALAMGISIRWGGDWDNDNNFDDQTFNDLPHFELIKK